MLSHISFPVYIGSVCPVIAYLSLLELVQDVCSTNLFNGLFIVVVREDGQEAPNNQKLCSE